MGNLEWGTWNAICKRCGFKKKAYQLRKEWTGLMVCNECWEPRHPQDLTKAVKESPPLPWTSPEPADVFVETNYVGAGVGVQPPEVPSGNFTTNNETP